MRKYIIFIALCVLATFSACTDNVGMQYHDMPGEDNMTPLRLHVGNLVDLTTRGSNPGLQNAALALDAEIGLFVVLASDLDSLNYGIVSSNGYYGYDNLRCKIGASGEIVPMDTTELFFPLGTESKVYVFAYAPYDYAMDRERLLLADDSVSVDFIQSSDELILKNDFILGVPQSGNPVCRSSTGDYSGKSIGLKMRHQRCQLILNVTIQGTSALLDNHSIFYADSILVYAENVPVSAPRGYSLDSVFLNYCVADSIVYDTVLMSVYKDIAITENQEFTLPSTAIVLPSDSLTEPAFCVKFISGEETFCVRRRVSEALNYRRGTSMTFSTVISSKVSETDKYVDLGLSSGTLWAKYNVGADSELEIGEYFAWGETYSKRLYLKETYFDPNDVVFNTGNNKSLIGTEYDTATQLWGEEWVMPTREQALELYFECEWTWVSNYKDSGLSGSLVTGPNGNSIFLPAGGLMMGNLHSWPTSGNIWVGTLNRWNDIDWACFIDFTDKGPELQFVPHGNSYLYVSQDYRWWGRNVRAVRKQNK